LTGTQICLPGPTRSRITLKFPKKLSKCIIALAVCIALFYQNKGEKPRIISA